jgi:DUF2075 family protein
MLNAYYSDSIEKFILKSTNEIIGEISIANKFETNSNTTESWRQQVEILKLELENIDGEIYIEFSIPRMGKRVDCVLIIKGIVFVLEFKVGEIEYLSHNVNQVWDYALDLKNFHKPSHNAIVIPILVATEGPDLEFQFLSTSHKDGLILPLKTNKKGIRSIIIKSLNVYSTEIESNLKDFIYGSYHPTPSIIEAAVNLYNEHSVEEITRNDAQAKNLSFTTNSISKKIEFAKLNNKKIICFVTGVPGAGKTLVGLKVATTHLDKSKGDSSVFLSGNKPLVDILQEALTRDKVKREKEIGNRITKSSAKEGVKSFIQIIHHYRDAYLVDSKAPYDHVAIFDEAQRAWNKAQTVDFMRRKKNRPNFNYSEPEFLISCLDRHKDWALIVCLVGGGQEINTGEAGISEWLHAINNSFPNWEIHISPNLKDKEYNAIKTIEKISINSIIKYDESLHLSVSMRSYRAEKVSLFIKQILDLDIENGKSTFSQINEKYPIVITRDLNEAKKWLKEKSRGNERYGIVVSSQAQRLKPLAIDVKSPMNPVNWFLDDKDDVRSSYYLEDVATEFQVQGLELDWACVTWDGDFRYSKDEWKTYSFVGKKWQNIHKSERKKYLLNAYRVLLTRARQGMVIVVPEGSLDDQTRNPEFYNSTFEYLSSFGIPVI